MATKTAITWEEFLAAGEEWQRWECVDGKIEFLSPVSLRNQAILLRLVMALGRYCEQHAEWLCFPGDATFTMSSGSWRCPDLSVVRSERLPDGHIPDAPGSFPPDMVFEIFSSRDTASQIQSKRKNYQESGVIQVWIDAERRLVELIYPDRPVHFFQENQPLVIDKLADLSVDLKTLFSI